MISNMNKTRKDKIIKLVIAYIILTLLSYVFLNYINPNTVLAAQTRESYSDKIESYIGYKELIEKLKEEHPTWNFTIFYTGLDWNQVIKNETTAYHGRNVVPYNRSNAWKCSICGNTPHGGSSWRCASEAAVAYYMDPRNWLNSDFIFQFENLAYNGEIQTVEGVQKIIAPIKYMQGEKVTYTNTQGEKVQLDKSYAQVIVDAAKEAKISPYHLASRIRQEQGAGSSPGSTATGTYKGYVGYYNFLNIKASGSTDREVIVNGMEHAKKNNWTDPEISIKAGAKELAKNYIGDGQDTLYLQKFDVDNSDGTLYYFQYMQNVSACITEGASVKRAYEELEMLEASIEFIIPVYENMPETACPEPIDGSIVTQNVKIKGTNVKVRSAATIASTEIATVNTSDTLLRIELAATKNGEYYWDKVVLPDGRKGYIARNYLVETTDVTNCNDTVVTNTGVNLRNGPGLNGTTIITMLTKGQALTRIETGMYNNLDGYNWDRVQLADGRQGYVAQNYIEIPGEEKPEEDENSAKTELIKVICNSGLKVREEPGTSQKILTYVKKDAILTRTQEGISNANGYIWDKIVTTDGIEGYIARGDSKEQYIEVIESKVEVKPETKPEVDTEVGKQPEEEPEKEPEKQPDLNTEVNPNKNDNYKIQESNLICEPETTIESIKERNKDKTILVKNSKGEEITTGNIGTGYTITVDKNTYTIVKLGDVNGDGEIDIIDMALIKRDIVNKEELKDVYKQAAKLSEDSLEIDIIDMALIKRHLIKTQLIKI